MDVEDDGFVYVGFCVGGLLHASKFEIDTLGDRNYERGAGSFEPSSVKFQYDVAKRAFRDGTTKEKAGLAILNELREHRIDEKDVK